MKSRPDLLALLPPELLGEPGPDGIKVRLKPPAAGPGRTPTRNAARPGQSAPVAKAGGGGGGEVARRPKFGETGDLFAALPNAAAGHSGHADNQGGHARTATPPPAVSAAGAGAVPSGTVSPPPPPTPASVTGAVRYEVRIVNGRVVREGRHPDSAYAQLGVASASLPLAPEGAPLVRQATPRGYVRLAQGRTGPGDPLRALEYVVVDVETTGAGIGHRITEICIVRMDGSGRIVGEYSTLVNPMRPIPPMITSLTHINGEMVHDAPRFRDIAPDVQQWLNGAVFVAHNASFDWHFVSRELLHATGQPLQGRMLCTVRLARKFVPEIHQRSLDALCYLFGIENEARHRAFGDARVTAHLFRILLDRIEERSIEGWDQLQRKLYARAGRKKRSAMPRSMEWVP